MANQFITIRTLHNGLGKIISLDNIFSVEPYQLNYTRIVLKEMKGGENVEVLCSDHSDKIAALLHEATKK